MATITVNGESRTFDGDPGTPLLWYLRDVTGLTGTKYGCGQGVCGACTIHLDGVAMRACTLPSTSAPADFASSANSCARRARMRLPV